MPGACGMHDQPRLRAGRSTSMRGRLAAPLDAARQAELDEVPRQSRLHAWVAHVLPQDRRPAAHPNTTCVTGAGPRAAVPGRTSGARVVSDT